jgi:UDP-N-acetylglucosamine 4,6-dehydratase/5-epimerase
MEKKMTKNTLNGKTLLITGGTGSFGNATLDRFLGSGVKEVRIFSRDENKQDSMRHVYKNDAIKFYIGDVRDLSSLQGAMRGVDFVFHAAALKQVPSCEFNPIEAVKTNVLGTDNVLSAAVSAGVKRVVCLSTDKAAYPINAMGLSKAMMEKVAIARSRTTDGSDTTICCTRYGNVMCSRGSVIPLFVEQIKAGVPLTVTEPNMKRFLMTLEDAVDLVDFAFNIANTGDILVQKSPAATIGVVVEALKQLFNAKNPVNIIGIRHGEKMFETLLTKEEFVKAEDMGGYYRVPADMRNLNYDSKRGNERETDAMDEFNSNTTEQLDVEQVKGLLLATPYIRKELGL